MTQTDARHELLSFSGLSDGVDLLLDLVDHGLLLDGLEGSDEGADGGVVAQAFPLLQASHGGASQPDVLLLGPQVYHCKQNVTMTSLHDDITTTLTPDVLLLDPRSITASIENVTKTSLHDDVTTTLTPFFLLLGPQVDHCKKNVTMTSQRDDVTMTFPLLQASNGGASQPYNMYPFQPRVTTTARTKIPVIQLKQHTHARKHAHKHTHTHTHTHTLTQTLYIVAACDHVPFRGEGQLAVEERPVLADVCRCHLARLHKGVCNTQPVQPDSDTTQSTTDSNTEHIAPPPPLPTHARMHALSHARTHTHTHARTHARARSRARARTHARTHAHTHTHTHTHNTHTHTMGIVSTAQPRKHIHYYELSGHPVDSPLSEVLYKFLYQLSQVPWGTMFHVSQCIALI